MSSLSTRTANFCETMRCPASRPEGVGQVALSWNDASERLMARAREGQPSARLVVVHTAGRNSAVVQRASQEGAADVVLVGLHQEAVDALVQLRPHLDDTEMALVAHSLGFGG